jgi:hypothetical protein
MTTKKNIWAALTGSDPKTMTVSTGRQHGKSTLSGIALDRLIKDIFEFPLEKLVYSEGTVYGSRYYCVEPIGGNWMEMEVWCTRTFGNSGNHIWGEKMVTTPAERWYMNNRKFWFREEKDRMQFALRWA